MNDDMTTPSPRTRRRTAGAIGLLAAGALTGAVLAGTWSANAADSPTSPSTTPSYGNTAPNGTAGQGGPGHGGPGGSAPVRGDETQLTGTDASKARAAALKAVPGGTVYRVETDAGDAAYEVHMTKADGTLVTVKLDKSFSLVAVEDGMGKGDPAPSGQGGAPGQSGTSSQNSSGA